MEYNLKKIRDLSSSTSFLDDDFVLAEVQDPSNNNAFVTTRMRADHAFLTSNIRVANAGNIQIEINDPIFDGITGFPDSIGTQDDVNTLFVNAINGLVDSVNDSVKVLLSNSPPTLPDFGGEKRYHNEGTLWIDTRTFRTYTYLHDKDPISGIIEYHWIGLTDR